MSHQSRDPRTAWSADRTIKIGLRISKKYLNFVFLCQFWPSNMVTKFFENLNVSYLLETKSEINQYVMLSRNWAEPPVAHHPEKWNFWLISALVFQLLPIGVNQNTTRNRPRISNHKCRVIVSLEFIVHFWPTLIAGISFSFPTLWFLFFNWIADDWPLRLFWYPIYKIQLWPFPNLELDVYKSFVCYGITI